MSPFPTSVPGPKASIDDDRFNRRRLHLPVFLSSRRHWLYYHVKEFMFQGLYIRHDTTHYILPSLPPSFTHSFIHFVRYKRLYLNRHRPDARRLLLQVNYTRKVQHFAAYLVPLLFSPSHECNCRGTLEVWGLDKIMSPQLLQYNTSKYAYATV